MILKCNDLPAVDPPPDPSIDQIAELCHRDTEYDGWLAAVRALRDPNGCLFRMGYPRDSGDPAAIITVRDDPDTHIYQLCVREMWEKGNSYWALARDADPPLEVLSDLKAERAGGKND